MKDNEIIIRSNRVNWSDFLWSERQKGEGFEVTQRFLRKLSEAGISVCFFCQLWKPPKRNLGEEEREPEWSWAVTRKELTTAADCDKLCFLYNMILKNPEYPLGPLMPPPFLKTLYLMVPYVYSVLHLVWVWVPCVYVCVAGTSNFQLTKWA